MKAIDIRNHFIRLADWVDPNHTADRIILGDPDTEIHSVLVTWISSFYAVRVAVERGFDMLMTHEATFWDNDERHNMERLEIGLIKKRFIEKSGLVILRNHDVWDRMPEIGITWSWARFLGLGTTPTVTGGRSTHQRYDVEPITLEELAQRIAERTATVGEPFVQVVGDGCRKVSRVGIGTGCGCNIFTFQKMGCDVSITCDDGSSYWQNIQCAADNDHPIICLNHGTSEEPGMLTLAEYLNNNLSGVKAEHLPHGCSFRLVGTGN